MVEVKNPWIHETVRSRYSGTVRIFRSADNKFRITLQTPGSEIESIIMELTKGEALNVAKSILKLHPGVDTSDL